MTQAETMIESISASSAPSPSSEGVWIGYRRPGKPTEPHWLRQLFSALSQPTAR